MYDVCATSIYCCNQWSLLKPDCRTEIFAVYLWLIIYTTKHFQARPRNKKYFSRKHLIIVVMAICMESCFQAWPSNKNICGALSLTDNIHGIMFSFQDRSQNKKYFLFKRMIIAVKAICAEACFQARPSNKNICCVIFAVGNINCWLHHNKTKKSIVAEYEYMKSLKNPSTIVHKIILVRLFSHWDHKIFTFEMSKCRNVKFRELF